MTRNDEKVGTFFTKALSRWVIINLNRKRKDE